MLVRFGPNQFHHLLDARGQAGPLLAAGGGQGQGRVGNQPELAVPIHGRAGVRRNLMVMHVQLWQLVPLVGVPQVRRLLQEDGPRIDPQPELRFLVGVQGQVVRLGRVSLEEPGQGLASVHDAQEPGIVDQFFVAVRTRGRRGHEAVFHAAEQGKERLVRLGTEGPQHARLVQGHSVEQVYVQPTVAHTLVVGQVQALAVHLFGPPDKVYIDAQLGRIASKLAAHPERADDELPSAIASPDQAHDFELHDGLAQAKGGEYAPAPAVQRPPDDVSLVRLGHGVDVVGLDRKPGLPGHAHFGFEELTVAHAATSAPGRGNIRSSSAKRASRSWTVSYFINPRLFGIARAVVGHLLNHRELGLQSWGCGFTTRRVCVFLPSRIARTMGPLKRMGLIVTGGLLNLVFQLFRQFEQFEF